MPEKPPPKNLREVLKASGPRPSHTDKTGIKTAYASRFADNMARCIASGLRKDFPGILPDEMGRGAESPARAVRGPKRLDVNYSTPQLGLALGLSLKSVHFQDIGGSHRYTHNMKRNDEELRVESSGYHARQPYSVMVATLFLPYDACYDGGGKTPSSFGSWVKYLRPLTGRQYPGDDNALFERIFIGLYDPAVGTDAATVGLYDPPDAGMEFFDVAEAPPKHGRPPRVLTYQEFLSIVKKAYDRRNHVEFEWSSEPPAPPFK